MTVPSGGTDWSGLWRGWKQTFCYSTPEHLFTSLRGSGGSEGLKSIEGSCKRCTIECTNLFLVHKIFNIFFVGCACGLILILLWNNLAYPLQECFLACIHTTCPQLLTLITSYNFFDFYINWGLQLASYSVESLEYACKKNNVSKVGYSGLQDWEVETPRLYRLAWGVDTPLVLPVLQFASQSAWSFVQRLMYTWTLDFSHKSCNQLWTS